MLNDTGKKNSLRLKVLSLFVVIMFVSVTVICPVVRSDESSAAVVEEEPEMPEELLNEYIAEELENISNMAEEELMEEFGVTMEEYQESMEALSGTALMLVGDEEGNISVEYYESVDRGRAGPWTDGDYFYFGIESAAWTAIKWWFSDECINMLVDQACKGEIDAVAIAEKEFNDLLSSVEALKNAITDLDTLIQTLTEEIETLQRSIENYSIKMIDAYNRAIECAQSAYDSLDEMYTELSNEINAAEDVIDCLSNMSNKDFMNVETCALFRLTEVLSASAIFMKLAKDMDYRSIMKKSGLGKFSDAVIVVNILVGIAYGDYTGAESIMKEWVTDRGVNFCANKVTDGIEVIRNQMNEEITKLENDKLTVKNVREEAQIKLQNAEQEKQNAIESQRKAEIVDDKADDALEKANKEITDAENELRDSFDNYNTEKERLADLESKVKSGEIDEDDYDYRLQKSKVETLESEYKVKEANFSDKSKKVTAAEQNKKITERNLANETERVKAKDLEIDNQKSILKKNRLDTLKHGLDAVKTSAKVGVKAAAKASCKTAIAATGIGAVLMIALDIVMALLIKFIEDHLSSQGYNVDEQYGIMVKVKIWETITIEKTIRILWHTHTIRFTIPVPCVPHLEGVFIQ